MVMTHSTWVMLVWKNWLMIGEIIFTTDPSRADIKVLIPTEKRTSHLRLLLSKLDYPSLCNVENC